MGKRNQFGSSNTLSTEVGLNGKILILDILRYNVLKDM